MAKIIRINQDVEKNTLLLCSVFFLLSLGCILFGILSLAHWNRESVVYFWTWSFVYCAGVCLGYVFSLICLFKGRDRFVKLLLGGYIFLFFCLVFIYVLQKTGFFTVFKDERRKLLYTHGKREFLAVLFVYRALDVV